MIYILIYVILGVISCIFMIIQAARHDGQITLADIIRGLLSIFIWPLLWFGLLADAMRDGEKIVLWRSKQPQIRKD